MKKPKPKKKPSPARERRFNDEPDFGAYYRQHLEELGAFLTDEEREVAKLVGIAPYRYAIEMFRAILRGEITAPARRDV